MKAEVIAARFKGSGKCAWSRQELKQFLSTKEQILADFWRSFELTSPEVDLLQFNDIINSWTVSVSAYYANSKELSPKMFLIFVRMV